MRTWRAIGLMSGTSMDGIDIAVLETDGETVSRFGPAALHPYREDEVALLRRAVEEARSLTSRDARPGAVADAEQMSTLLHAGAVRMFLDANGIDPASIDVIGFHGQTVLHRPDDRLTIQIGDGQALADETGIRVVYDLRAADVAEGGQGAPLVPVYHRALAAMLDRPRPIAVLNIGGVANVTFIDGIPDPYACDTGPGNALIDDFMRARRGEIRDENGGAAARGKVDEAAVARVLKHSFFALKPPKSLDRNAFREWVADRAQLAEKNVEDGAATLAAITAATVATIVPHLPEAPRSWIVCGGGANNATLVRMLGERLAPARVETAGDVGWNADAIEAQAFAYMAVRSLRGLPITFPTTTAVPKPMTGGVLAEPRAAGRKRMSL
ncbi:anhydro-N-acetylmuramic acid kinase [Pseudorhodoplanes sp.]|uniref:anhydro-N-acetylmuramic acid kinase n=1 Tax=Pseudorhodoplanes sp. TaxID=1934341 RepID=UPI002C9A056B|nr:anhydro-N-acetylmuramic acid kinase [Pseudorhodoplanes sp.]HWV52576.1 anhydro-N-acetylmuramic acid kinase [Pseudorhodoplanes sp.]